MIILNANDTLTGGQFDRIEIRGKNVTIKGNELYNNTVGVKVTGNSTGLVVAENNEYGSSSQSFNLAGEHTNAVIRGNTYFTATSNSATFAGDTTFVEQFNS